MQKVDGAVSFCLITRGRKMTALASERTTESAEETRTGPPTRRNQTRHLMRDEMAGVPITSRSWPSCQEPDAFSVWL